MSTTTTETTETTALQALERAMAHAVEKRNAELSRVHQLHAKAHALTGAALAALLDEADEHAARAASMGAALVGLAILLDEARAAEANTMDEPAYHAEMMAERR